MLDGELDVDGFAIGADDGLGFEGDAGVAGFERGGEQGDGGRVLRRGRIGGGVGRRSGRGLVNGRVVWDRVADFIDILDDAAVEMVRRASPYPPIPSGLGATITIQAPIAFDLPR